MSPRDGAGRGRRGAVPSGALGAVRSPPPGGGAAPSGAGLAEPSRARRTLPSAKMAAGEPQAKKLKLEPKQLR